MASDNKSLGRFILDGIPPAPRGVPQIEVTFDIDANGILHVTAKDKATGRSQHITIAASSGLSETEVEKMRQDAEVHAEADRKRKELIEARNEADNMAYAAEKVLKEDAGPMPRETRAEIETMLADVRSKAQGEDTAQLVAATRALGEAIQKVGAAAHEQPQAGPSATGGAAAAGAGTDVVDGEVKE